MRIIGWLPKFAKCCHSSGREILKAGLSNYAHVSCGGMGKEGTGISSKVFSPRLVFPSLGSKCWAKRHLLPKGRHCSFGAPNPSYSASLFRGAAGCYREVYIIHRQQKRDERINNGFMQLSLTFAWIVGVQGREQPPCMHTISGVFLCPPPPNHPCSSAWMGHFPSSLV